MFFEVAQLRTTTDCHSSLLAHTARPVASRRCRRGALGAAISADACHSPPEKAGLRTSFRDPNAKESTDLAVFVDRPIQIVSCAPNGNGGLVYAQDEFTRRSLSSPASFEFRYVAQDPTHEIVCGTDDAALGHHGSQVR